MAAEVLAVNQERKAAEYLNQWFDVFRERYLAGKRQQHLAEDNALTRLLDDQTLAKNADT